MNFTPEQTAPKQKGAGKQRGPVDIQSLLTKDYERLVGQAQKIVKRAAQANGVEFDATIKGHRGRKHANIMGLPQPEGEETEGRRVKGQKRERSAKRERVPKLVLY